MIKKQGYISTFQLYGMFYIFRTVGTFTYMLRLRAPLSASDRAIVAIFCFLFLTVFSAPVFLCIKKAGNSGFLNLSSTISPLYAKALSIFYALSFLWAAAVVAARFSLFSGIVLLQQENLNIFLFVLLAVSIYCASKGLEPLARTSMIMAVILLISLFLMTVAASKDFNPIYLSLPLQNGMQPVILQGFYSACRTVELTALLFIAPKTSGALQKGFFIWIAVFCVQFALLFLAVGAIAGDYGELQMFPLYTLASLAKIGILERMDDLLTGIWVICAMLKTAFLMHTSVSVIEQGFNIKKKQYFLPLCGAAVFIGNLFLSQNIEFFGRFIASPVNPVLFIASAVVIPLVTYTLHKTKIRKK